jgi:hypothetical protein
MQRLLPKDYWITVCDVSLTLSLVGWLCVYMAARICWFAFEIPLALIWSAFISSDRYTPIGRNIAIGLGGRRTQL